MSSLLDSIRQARPYKNLGPEVWDGALDPDEQVLWTGRPAQGLRVTQMAVGFVALAVLALGIMALILFVFMPDPGALSLPALLILGFISSIFIAMPILLIWLETWMRQFLHYAVTDRRAVILDAQGGPPFRLTSYLIEPGMKLSMSAGRLRTLWFKPRIETSVEVSKPSTYVDPLRMQAGAHMHAIATAQMTYDSRAPKAFRFLEDADVVRDLIRQVANGTYRSGQTSRL